MDRNGERDQSQDDDGLRQLERDRISNDHKLKSRFEHIFRKYEHDFEGVGDEIDIQSGDIVVNNGHLQHMRYEVDPGKGASSRFVRTFQEKLDQESETGSSGEDESLEDEDDDGEEDDEEKLTENDTSEVTRGELSDRGSVDTFASSGLRRSLRPFSEMARPAPRLAHLLVGEGASPQALDSPGDTDSQYARSTPSIASTPSNILGKVPNLRQSVLSLNASRQEAGSDTIQALGVTIANQLAQLMAGPSKKRKRRPQQQRRWTESRDPVWGYPEIGRASPRNQPRSPSPVVPLQRSSPPTATPGGQSLWAPSESAQSRKRRRLNWHQPQMQESSSGIVSQHASTLLSSGARTSADVRRCWNCSLTRTESWHEGPHGQDLCASCGKYYEYHRRMKPFDSPTPSLEDDEEGAQEEPREAQMNVEGDTRATEDLTRQDQLETQHSLGPRPHLRPPDASASVSLKKQAQLSEQYIPSDRLQDSTSGVRRAHPTSPTLDSRQRHFESHMHDVEQERSGLAEPLVSQEAAEISELVEDIQDGETANHANRGNERPSTPEPLTGSTVSPSGYSANTSRPILNSPSGCKRSAKYTVEEDAKIIKLKEYDSLSWETIQDCFPGRSRWAIQAHYNQYLRHYPSLGRKYLNAQLGILPDATNTVVNSSLSKDNAWNKEQDELLIELRKDKELPWTEIAGLLPGHTPGAVEQRYGMLLEAARRHHPELQDEESLLDSDLASAIRRKDRFSAEEDAMIVRLREVDGLNWSQIAERFPCRQIHSVQKRYSLALEPTKRKIKKTSRFDPIWGTMEDRLLAVDPSLAGGAAFTPAEDQLIKDLKQQELLRWHEIAARLPGRTCKAVQHRYAYRFSDALPIEEGTSGTLQDEDVSHLGLAGRPSRMGVAEEQPRVGPGARRPFTEKEDNLIMHMKEVEDRSWKEIALELPWRNANSVASRYRDVLRYQNQEQPSRRDRGTSPTQDLTLTAGEPSDKQVRLVRYTPQEDSLIIRLYQRGLHWADIAAQLPGRTQGSIQNHWSSKLKYTVRKSLPGTSNAQRTDSPLLRKAVSNRLRRRTVHNQPLHDSRTGSEEVEPENDDDVSSLLSDANSSLDEVSFDHVDDECEANDLYDMGQKAADGNQEQDSAMAKTQIVHSLPGPSHGSDIQMLETLLQAATRFAVQQTNPSLFARIRDIYDQDSNDPRLHRLLEVVSVSSASSSDVIATLEHVVNASPDSSKSATRSLQAALTNAKTRPGTGKPRPTRQAPYPDSRRPFAIERRGQRLEQEPSLGVVTEPAGIALSRHSGHEENEKALMDAFEPTRKSTSTMKGSSKATKPQGASKSSKRSTKWPLAREGSAAGNRRSARNEAHCVTPEATPPPVNSYDSPSSTGQLSPEPTLASPTRPELSFSQLVRVAFEANARPMQCKDIYEWVETNYEFYRLSPPSWKARVRAELSANPSFERTITAEGERAWQLVEGVDTEPWGITRGPRRKRGVPPMPFEDLDVDDSNAAHADGADTATAIVSKHSTSDPLEGHPEQPMRTDRQPDKRNPDIDAPHLQADVVPLHVGTANGINKASHNAKICQESSNFTDVDFHAPTSPVIPDSEAESDTETIVVAPGAAYRSREGPEIGRKAHAKPRKLATQKKKSLANKSIARKKSRANSLLEQQIIDLTQLDDELSSNPAPPVDSPVPPLPGAGNQFSIPTRLKQNISGMASFGSPGFVRVSTPARSYGPVKHESPSVRASSVSRGSPLTIFVQRSTPALAGSARRSSGLARFVETPVREVDSDEDELA
ncbi:unnamed protein product [Lecanosticta acicola]|uniref:Unnamed protein product n=1 Tax=Lecanosticta acicola TaxID=111012 RepID=A0AAI8Z2N5_9PEZI|nr:unnamed protein product [Lecanosticta acicola]